MRTTEQRQEQHTGVSAATLTQITAWSLGARWSPVNVLQSRPPTGGMSPDFGPEGACRAPRPPCLAQEKGDKPRKHYGTA